MQPAMKISLVRLAEALSPGSTRQNSVLLILCMTCTGSRNPVTHPAGSERLLCQHLCQHLLKADRRCF